MVQKKTNYLISVDAETGVYWHGERKLQTRAQADAIIKQIVSNQKNIKHYANRGQTLLQFAALKIIRAAGMCFKVRKFSF